MPSSAKGSPAKRAEAPAPHITFSMSQCSKKGEDRSVSMPRIEFPLPVARHGATTAGEAGESEAALYGMWGIFDGHNGPLAAEFAAQTLPELFHRQLEQELKGGAPVERAVCAALAAAFLQADRTFSEANALGGTTATVCVIYGWLCTVACVGDSRAICDNGVKVCQLTEDFRLEDSAPERERVMREGGVLRRLAHDGQGPCDKQEAGFGPLRVWPGGLCLSRAIGDRDVGACIIAHPHLHQFEVPRSATRIIIASDGVWDAVNNEQVSQDTRQLNAKECSKSVVNMALRARGLRDDVTVCTIDLSPTTTCVTEQWAAAAGCCGGMPCCADDEPDALRVLCNVDSREQPPPTVGAPPRPSLALLDALERLESSAGSLSPSPSMAALKVAMDVTEHAGTLFHRRFEEDDEEAPLPLPSERRGREAAAAAAGASPSAAGGEREECGEAQVGVEVREAEAEAAGGDTPPPGRGADGAGGGGGPQASRASASL